MKHLRKPEENVIYSLRELYHRYGYRQFKMSKFEPYDLYAQNKEFLVSDGVITFTDTDGTLMALKPDVTLSIVKNFRRENTVLQKVCYNENVYRIAGAGRTYREITQTGLECLGDIGLYEISEVLCLAAKSLAVISDNYVLDISHMGIVWKLLSDMDLSEEEISNALYLLGEKNSDALCEMLGAEKSQRIAALLNITGTFRDAVDALSDIIDCDVVSKLHIVSDILCNAGLSEHVNLDFSIVGNRNYYNDFVFRGYVEGLPSALLAGGQYDRLMEKMGKRAKGVGFAVYLDQLELLNTKTSTYDIDTVLLYSDDADIVELSTVVDKLSPDGVLPVKAIPSEVRYRRLIKLEDGRLLTIEENG